MIIYFADRSMNILGLASTGLPEGFLLTNDNKTEDIDTGVAVFEAELNYKDSNHVKAKAIAKEGNFVLRQNGERYEAYTIIEKEDNTLSQTIYFYAEDAGLDLLNSIAEAFTADEAHPAEWYIDKWAHDSGFTVGINEISTLNRKLSWDGEATVTERIRSVATQFDNAEIGYSFKINNFRITNKYIDIYKRHGKDIAQELRLGREIGSIIEKSSIASLATALYVTGGTPDATDAVPEPQPITLKGYSYDDGDIYVEASTGVLKSRTALNSWGRYLADGSDAQNAHITRTYSWDTLIQSELASHAITELKKIREPEVNYEIELLYLPENLALGDTVRIVDDNGELYLSARLLKLEVSEANDTRVATFGDFLIKSSGISARLEALADEFSKIAASRTLYTWIVYADTITGEGISTSAAGKAYIGIATNKIATEPDLSDASIYSWTKIQGTDGEDGKDGKDGAPGKDGTNGTNGTNGKNGTIFRNKGAWAANTAYVSNDEYIDVVTYNGSSYYCKTSHTSGSSFVAANWTVLAQKGVDGINGTNGKDGSPGKDGTNGTSNYIHIKYAAVANPTDSQMSENPDQYIGICVNTTLQDPTTASSYTWSKFEGTDGTNGLPGKDSYVHFAYSISSDGKERFSTVSFDGASYIGVRTDNTQADSTNYKDYEWSQMRGEDGSSPVITTAHVNSETIIYADGVEIGRVADGANGKTPAITATKVNGVTTIKSDGTSIATINDGSSVLIQSATKSGDTTTVVLKDASGTKTLTIKDGEDGENGTPGVNGYVHIAWANSADGKTDFSTTVSTGKTYMGSYTDNTAADSTDPTKYNWSLIKGAQGDKGDKGDKGDPGASITSVTNYYLASASSSGVTRSTSGWTTDVTNANAVMTATKQYLWNYEVVKNSAGTTVATTDPCIIGRYGQNGSKGATGATGKGISSITEHYQVSSSNTTAPTTWSDSMVNTTTTNKYLWNYETITYTDGTSEDSTKRVIGTHGATGAKGDKGDTGTSVTVSKTEYQSGTSATTAPTGTWSTSVPEVAEGNYLWTKVTFSDSKVVYSVAKQGKSGTNGTNGTSVTVKSTAYAYQLSTSGTTVPTGTWQTTPQAPTTTQYAWTRTTTTFSDNSTAVTYTVGGKTGTNGTSASVQYITSSADVLVKSISNTFTPTSVTFSFYTKTGTGNPSAYSGRCIIAESTDGSSYTNKYTSSANESSKAYTPSAATVKFIRCTLYAAGGTSTVLDVQTVGVVSDGATGAKGATGSTGATGAAGADAYTVILTNENHTFAGGTSAAVAGSATCNVIAYKGATQVAATIGTISGAPTGMTTSITSNGTTSAYFTVTVTTAMVTKNGVLTIPVTVDGKSFSMKFTYSLALTGATGAKGDTGSKGDKGDKGDSGITNGYTIQWFYGFDTSWAGGEALICGYDQTTGTVSASAAGWVMWNGTKRTVPRVEFNPNNILPYNIPIYLVLRLSSATATTGTVYPVWYASGWKYNPKLSSPAAADTTTWTWVEATDIVLGKCVEPGNEQYFADTEIYDPTWTCRQVTSITVTANSANAAAATAQSTANTAKSTADNALTTANGKNKVYHQASQPSGGTYVTGDTWFDTDDGYKMYTYNGSSWVAESFGSAAIADLAITNAKIANGTIQNAKIATVDAGKITTGTLSADRIAANSIVLGKLASDVKTYVSNEANTAFERAASSGEQLITNGSGILGDNTNFSNWTFDGSQSNGTPGSFTRTSTAYAGILIDEFFAVDTTKSYRFDFDGKSKDSTGTVYSCLACYDVDKKLISPPYFMYQANTLTTLTQDLKPGDTVVHLNDLTNWITNTGTKTYQRGFIFWNYKNSYGYQYPELTYSRNYYSNLYTDANVNKTAKTITLSSAWPASYGTIPSGTKLSQSNSGSQYSYGLTNRAFGTTWVSYSTKYSGVNSDGRDVSGLFRPATAYCKVGFLWNYSKSTTDQLWITNLQFYEDYKTDIEANATAIAAKKSFIQLTSSYSVTDAQLKSWSAEGTDAGNWSVTSTSGVQVGDTVQIKATRSTTSTPVYFVVTVTSITSATVLRGISHGYIDPNATVVADTANSTANTALTNAANAAKTATNYITYVDSTNGIRVYDGQSSNQNKNFTQMNSSGMQVYKDNVQVASFGEKAVIGKTGTTRVEMSSGSTEFYGVDNTEVAEITNGGSETYNTGIELFYKDSFDSGTSGSSETYSEASLDNFLSKLGSTFHVMVLTSSKRAAENDNEYDYTFTKTTSKSITINDPFCPMTLAYTYKTSGSSFKLTYGTIPDVSELDYIYLEAYGPVTVTTANYKFGQGASSSGKNSFAEGIGTIASGDGSHAEGAYTKATNNRSHAEGYSTIASGSCSHAEGYYSSASGYSHAEGDHSKATGTASHAEGEQVRASGTNSHAEGYKTTASGYGSHAQNVGTHAANNAETAIGMYNYAIKTSSGYGGYPLYIGNGDSTKGSNALLVDWYGNILMDIDDQDDASEYLGLAAEAKGLWASDTFPTIGNNQMVNLKNLLGAIIDLLPKNLYSITFTRNTTNTSAATVMGQVINGMGMMSGRITTAKAFTKNTTYVLGTVMPKAGKIHQTVFARQASNFARAWLDYNTGEFKLNFTVDVASGATIEFFTVYMSTDS